MNELKKELENPVFIVSTGRCGSTMLSRILAIHPSLFVFNQYPSLRTEAFVKWSDPRRVKEIEKKIRKKREELLNMVRRNRLIYVENSTSAALLIDELYRLFNARFIFIYRDARDFIRSGMSRGWYKPESLRHRFKTLIRRRFLIDTGKDTVDTLLIPPRDFKTRFEKIAWRWVEINRIILDRFSFLPDGHKLFFKVEELGRESLIGVHNFLGIKVDEAMIVEMLAIAATKPNKSPNHDFPPYGEWSEYHKRLFKKIAGDMMLRLGYNY